MFRSLRIQANFGRKVPPRKSECFRQKLPELPELLEDSMFFQELMVLMGDVDQLADWKLQDGIEAILDSKGNPKVQVKGKSKASLPECSLAGENLTQCSVMPYD